MCIISRNGAIKFYLTWLDKLNARQWQQTAIITFLFFFAFIVIRALKIVISCTSTCKEDPDISNNMSIYAFFKTYIHKIIDILLTNALLRYYPSKI